MAKLKFVFAEVELGPDGDTAIVGQLLRSVFDGLPSPGSVPVHQNGVAIAQVPAPKPRGRLPGPKVRKPAETAQPAAGEAEPINKRTAARNEVLDKIERWLEKVGGATSTEICKGCGIPTGSIVSYMKDPRFRKTDDGSWRVD